MSFNIGGDCTKSEGIYRWNVRAELGLAIMLKYDPDILACQEVPARSLAFYRERMVGCDSFSGVRTIAQNDEYATYNMVFWKKDRFEILDYGSFYLSHTPDKWSKYSDSMFVRGATWVKLHHTEQGHEFVCLNTHLDHAGAQARFEGSKVILDQLAGIRSKDDTPVVLAGDFNCRAWVPMNENQYAYPPPVIPQCLPPAGAIHDLFLQNGFQDTYLEVGHTDELDMNTYHDFCGKVFPPAALRIDWIMTSDGKFKVQTRQFLIIHDAEPPIYPSDHYPIIADLLFE